MPNQFVPLNSQSSNGALINQINSNLAKLDREAVVKQFKGSNGEVLTMGKTGTDTIGMGVNIGDLPAIAFGKYNATRYGLLLYDQNGVPSVLIGQAPDDGRMGMWQAKPGQNVLTLLGG